MTNKYESPDIFAYAIFCDDIRFETGNKVSIIGTYKSDMFFQEFPAFLPKLGIYACLNINIDFDIKLISLTVLRDDEKIVEIETEAETLPKAEDAPEGFEMPNRRENNFYVVIPPLTINGQCVLKVEFNVDGEPLLAGRIRVRQAPNEPLKADVTA